MKQVILVRHDLKLSKGKMAAQVAHASVEATLRSNDTKVKTWRHEGMTKIVLKVMTLAELHKYNDAAKQAGLTTALITDAGRTEVPAGTMTCLAIGPDDDEKIDRVTKDLPLYS